MTARLRDRSSDLVLAGIGLAAGLIGGLLVGHSPQAALIFMSGCLLLILVLTRPVVLGVVAVLGCFAVQRLGGAQGTSGGISYSDLLIAAAAVIAMPSLAVGPELRRLRLALSGLAVYLVCLLPAVVRDHTQRGWFEWGHRFVLVGGALVVGAWLVREGYLRFTLRSLVVVATVVAALAILWTLRHGMTPASPLGMHKNFVGAQLSIVLVVVVATQRELLGLPSSVRLLATIVIAGGLLASQSRGAMLAAAVGIVFVIAFTPAAQTRRGRGIVLLISLALAGFVGFSLLSDLSQSAADLHNNSIGVRRQVEHRTLEIWRSSPFTGVGLKYFNSGHYGQLAQPANVVVDNELAESGIVGLIGFLLLQLLAITAGVLRRHEPFVIVGTACVTAALLHGMVDIYWTAATVPLPFLILGMALGDDRRGQISTTSRKISDSALVKT